MKCGPAWGRLPAPRPVRHGPPTHISRGILTTNDYAPPCPTNVSEKSDVIVNLVGFVTLPVRHNECMCAHTSGSMPWSGALAVDDGALCYLGSLAIARGHHHVATQLIRAWSGSFELTDARGRRCVGSAAVIPSGCHHSIRIAEPCSGFLLFVDPATVVGRHLSAMDDVTDDVQTWFAAGEVLQNWREDEFPDPATLLARLKETLSGTSELGHDNWHPSLRAAVELIAQRLPERVTLGDIATGVALSPSRLSRLFRDQVGQSFPAYVRWARGRLAIAALRTGASLTDAAHAAGFTDSAHANRVCYEMFGLSPSQASGQLVWS